MEKNLSENVIRTRQRFSDYDDLSLLKEVLGLNPFDNSGLWNIIIENMFSLTKKTFTVRSLKDRLLRLIKMWLEQQKAIKDQSGIEVTVTEKDLLCENVYSMMNENKHQKEKKSMERNLGVEARKKWAMGLENETASTSKYPSDHNYSCQEFVTEECASEDYVIIEDGNEEKHEIEIDDVPKVPHTPGKRQRNVTTTPNTINSKSSQLTGSVRARKRRLNAQRQGLEYLQKYDENSSQIKRKDQQLEEKKIDIEERKLALMEYEAKRKFELEEKKLQLEERRLALEEKKVDNTNRQLDNFHTIVERQEKIISFLLNK